MRTCPLVLFLGLLGCSGEDRPPTSSGAGGGGAPPPSPSSSPTGTADAGPKTELCTDVARGQPINAIAVAATDIAPLGGPISPGTYDLEELDVFVPGTEDPEQSPAPPPPSERAQATLVVTADTLKIVRGVAGQDGAFASATVQYGWLRAEGTNLILDELCPTRTTSTFPYTAAGAAIVLYPTKDRGEVYKLRR